jgi:flagellar biosynthesis protein FlhA
LIVSLAAGLIVTKGGTTGAANEAIFSQLSKFPKALYMAASLLLGIGLLPGFPLLVFTLLASLMVGLGYYIQKYAVTLEQEKQLAEEEQLASEAPAGDDIQDIIKLDDMWLELGMDIVPLVNSEEAALPGKIKSLRKLFAKEFGFILPPVRIKDEPMLPNSNYAILVQGVEVARGEVYPTKMMVINPTDTRLTLPGIHTKEPAFGLDAVWVSYEDGDKAESEGYTVVDPESVITTHLTAVIKEHMPELLTYGATCSMIDKLDREYKKLVSEIPISSPAILIQQVLQSLLMERVSIRNFPLIIEAITEASRTSTKVTTITEYVRLRLSNQICKSLTDDSGFISVITMSPEWEKEFKEAVRVNGDERNFVMSPQRVQEFVLAARKNIQQFAEKNEWPALLVAPEVRSFVRSMLERASPLTQVISHNEVHRKAILRTVATIGN